MDRGNNMRIPRTLVHAGLIVAFVMGQVIVWNDKRMDRSEKLSSKSIGSEKLA